MLQVRPSLVDGSDHTDNRWVWRRPAVVFQIPDTVIADIVHGIDPRYHQRQAGMERSDVAACIIYINTLVVRRGRIACTECRDAACCYGCSVVCLCVCWSQNEPYKNG